MTPAAQEKLRVLRQRLADLEPYPWEPVEAWIASARPLIKAQYRDHSSDFADVIVTPRWCQLPRFASGGGHWGGPRRDNFAQAAATEERENRKYSAAAKAKILAFLDGLLDLPAVEPAPLARKATGTMLEDRSSIGDHPKLSSLAAAIVHHHHGDTHMGSTFNNNFSNNNIGALAQGENANASNVGNQGAPNATLTQAQHIENIKGAKKALVDDEEQLGPLVSEALGQFLRMAREIQVEQKSLGEVQAKMKETLDEVWAKEAAKGLRPQVLPQGLKVVETLAKSPLMSVVVKALLGI